MSSLADKAITVTDLVARAASLGESALPAIQFFAGFFPGLAPAVTAVTVALPYIRKISEAAPQIRAAIEAGRPALDAIQAAGPQVLPYLKEVYAIAVNHDPERPETNMTGADVSNEEAVTLAGPALLGRVWTDEELQRHWDRDKQSMI